MECEPLQVLIADIVRSAHQADEEGVDVDDENVRRRTPYAAMYNGIRLTVYTPPHRFLVTTALCVASPCCSITICFNSNATVDDSDDSLSTITDAVENVL